MVNVAGNGWNIIFAMQSAMGYSSWMNLRALRYQVKVGINEIYGYWYDVFMHFKVSYDKVYVKILMSIYSSFYFNHKLF